MQRHPAFSSTLRTGLCALAVAALLSPVVPTAAQAASTTVGIASGVNDAEEMGNGHILLNDRDLDMGYYQGKRTVALRYTLNVPKGAKISNATLQFKAVAATSAKLVLAIRAEDVDNASAFSTRTRNLTGRSKTSAVVKWTVPSWKSVGHRNADQQTPDIKSVIQEVVNRNGWKAGNSIVILLSHDSGTARRIAMANDASSSTSPELKVTYSGASASGSGKPSKGGNNGGSEEVPVDNTDLTPSNGSGGGIDPALLNAAMKALSNQALQRVAAASRSSGGWTDPNSMADSNDTYRYARMLNTHMTGLTHLYRTTGDKKYAAEVDRLLERMRKKLGDPNRDGYRNWIYQTAPGSTDKSAKGKDTHVMDELMSHANVAGAAYTIKQAGYSDHAKFWTDYLTKDFEPKWRKRNSKSSGFPFIEKKLTHPYIQGIRLYYYMGKLTGKSGYMQEAQRRAKILHNHFKPVSANGKDAYVWAHFIDSPGKMNGCVPNPYIGLTVSGLSDLYTAKSGLVSETDLRRVATGVGSFAIRDNLTVAPDNCGGVSRAGLSRMNYAPIAMKGDGGSIGLLGKLDASGRTRAIFQRLDKAFSSKTAVEIKGALLSMSK